MAVLGTPYGDAPKANAVVGQSGGPTGVINASLVGVIEEANKHPEIENLYGAIHAVAGMVKEEFIDLKKLSADTLEEVAASPSSALASSRDKPDAEPGQPGFAWSKNRCDYGKARRLPGRRHCIRQAKR